MLQKIKTLTFLVSIDMHELLKERQGILYRHIDCITNYAIVHDHKSPIQIFYIRQAKKIKESLAPLQVLEIATVVRQMHMYH